MEGLLNASNMLTVDTSKPFDSSSWHDGKNKPCNDPYFIKAKTSNKFVEIQRVRARGHPTYAVETSWKTGLPTSDLDYGVVLVHGSVLYFFKTRNTGGLVQCSRFNEDYSKPDSIVSLPGLACPDDRTIRDRNNRNINVSEGKLVISDGDIYFIHLRNTRSGMVELHRWRYKSNFQDADLHVATPFEATTADADENHLDVWAGRLVWVSNFENGKGNRLHVHGTAAEDGRNDYSRLAPVVEIDYPASGRDGDFYVTPNLDLIFVKLSNTPKYVEVHVVTRSTSTIHIETGLSNDSVGLGKICLDKASFNPELTGDAALSSWMGFLPDHTKLTTMTIPGTHDSHATSENCPEYAVDWAQTQYHDITHQLENGVRYLDLRVGEGLRMRKGVAEMKGRFDDCTNEIHSFLNDHPTETVLVSVKWNQNHPSEPSNMEREVARVWKAKGWYAEAEWPTVDEVRGKAVLLRCFKGSVGIDCTGFRSTSEKGPPGAWHRQEDDGSGKADDDGTQLSSWKHFEDLRTMPEKQRREMDHIMFLTDLASRDGGSTAPRVHAEEINAQLMRYVRDTGQEPVHLGVIIMDFFEPEHAAKIVSWNFSPHRRLRE